MHDIIGNLFISNMWQFRVKYHSLGYGNYERMNEQKYHQQAALDVSIRHMLMRTNRNEKQVLMMISM